jgi:hypothetical protein
MRQFEQQISVQTPTPKIHISEGELDELCGIAQAVPTLWKVEAVNDEERKEILHCVIDHIEVAATKERIDARIFWKSGSIKSIFVWRFPGRLNLIRELHAQRLTACEIREHLARGKTSTGQVLSITLGSLYSVMHTMGLKQHRFSLRQLSAEQKAVDLYRNGHSVDWIARYLEKEGFTTPSGKPWTASIVSGRLHWISDKPGLLRKIHHRLIGEALARGRDYAEISREFNQKKIRRVGRARWTAGDLARRWNELNPSTLGRNAGQRNGGNGARNDKAA